MQIRTAPGNALVIDSDTDAKLLSGKKAKEASADEFTADCAARNDKAAEPGIATRYEVV